MDQPRDSLVMLAELVPFTTRWPLVCRELRCLPGYRRVPCRRVSRFDVIRPLWRPTPAARVSSLAGVRLVGLRVPLRSPRAGDTGGAPGSSASNKMHVRSFTHIFDDFLKLFLPRSASRPLAWVLHSKMDLRPILTVSRAEKTKGPSLRFFRLCLRRDWF